MKFLNENEKLNDALASSLNKKSLFIYYIYIYIYIFFSFSLTWCTKITNKKKNSNQND